MTQIEDMLREALHELPTTSPTTDPLAAVNRRVRRARRRIALATGVAVVAVAAAIAVPLSVGAGGGDKGLAVAHTPTPAPSASVHSQPATTTWLHGSTMDVAVGPAGVWALVQGATSNHESYQLVQLDQSTGSVLRRVEVPGPVDFVAVDLAHVWAFGGGDGASGNLSVVDVVDPRTGDVATHQYHGAGAPQGMAFGTDSAWITLDTANRVDRLDLNGPKLGIHVTESVPVEHPTQIVSMPDGSLWVRGSKGLTQLSPSNGRGVSAKPATNIGRWPLFDSFDESAIWTSDSSQRVITFTPMTTPHAPVSVAYGHRLRVPGRPVLAKADVLGGVYVATADRTTVDAATDEATITFFDRNAVVAEAGPTATLRQVLVSWLAPDPAGGVLYVDDQGNLVHWLPTAR